MPIWQDEKPAPHRALIQEKDKQCMSGCDRDVLLAAVHVADRVRVDAASAAGLEPPQ
jgi:hypothetical protein